MKADFTPNMGTLKNVGQFRQWCQKILPLVYDDSLSYYELLCKVTSYLNDTIDNVRIVGEDVSSLYTAYTQLQEYVNSYFDNIDVQEEINNKLDEMANSGELYEIIRKYTNPIVNEQNEKINVLKSRMDTFTSLPDGSTAGNAELQDIRIGYNGKVYPNAGDAVRTQIGQLSSEITDVKSDLSESYSELKETIEIALNGYKNFTDYNWIDTYTLTSTDGSLISNENTYYMSATDYIPVNKGETISITGIGTIYRIWQYNLDKTVIANSMVATATESYEYTATKNVYIRFAIINNPDIEGYTSKDLIKTVIYAPVKDKFFLSWKNKTFVSLGDSITWQDGKEYTQGNVGVIARGYQTILKENLGFASYDNKGISGRPIANGTANGDGTVTTAQSVNYANFDLCIIAGGTNDFKLNVPIGKIGVIGDTVFDDTTFYGAYRKMLEHILTQKPTIRICLFTPLQRDNGGYDVNHTNTAGHKLIDYANAVKSVGEMYGIPVCDMYANSGFTKLTLATYTLDGLHPNDLGYERMGGYAAQFINAISN